MDFTGMDIISSTQFNRNDLEYIMDVAIDIENNSEKYQDLLKEKILALFFLSRHPVPDYHLVCNVEIRGNLWFLI
jgi:aspartate carbamoyltransferase catalytic subunit